MEVAAGPPLRLEMLHAMITWSYDAALQGTGAPLVNARSMLYHILTALSVPWHTPVLTLDKSSLWFDMIILIFGYSYLIHDNV
jgi:hypothetical protein